FDRSILNICMDIKINCILLFFIAPFHTGFCDTEEDYACMERTQTCKIAMFFNINQDDGDNEVLCQDYDFFFKCLFNQGCKRNQTKNEQLIEKYGDIIVSLGCYLEFSSSMNAILCIKSASEFELNNLQAGKPCFAEICSWKWKKKVQHNLKQNGYDR
uniref:Uncharacterized protein n=1 Tax=Biomphalaria glabrata TaxID=6526 RepID=A0A2C9LWE7_BIOGL